LFFSANKVLGHPITYTATAGGPTVTATSAAGAAGGSSGPNVGAIVAGVVAGVVAILAGYFAFCAWVYRRQLKLYKNHVAMVQRAAADPQAAEKEGFIMPVSTKNSSDRPSWEKKSGENSSSNKASGRSRGHQPSDSIDSTGGLLPVPNTAYGGAGPYHGAGGDGHRASSDAGSSTENLMQNMEPTFIGVLLNPRRSLRIVNND
jgi:hypothetical protein